MRRVGIIGGMGTLATLDLFNKIFHLSNAEINAKEDSAHIPLLIDNYPQIPDRSAFILSPLTSTDPYPYLMESALRLKVAGCEAICIACNTAHFWSNRLEQECEIKILHMNEIAVLALKERFPNAKNIAIIGTLGLKIAKVYDQSITKYGLNNIEINDDEMNIIMDVIYKGIKANDIDKYEQVLNNLINRLEADAFIAACTEIPILLPKLDKKNDFIDATIELAREIIKFALSSR